MTLLPLVGLVWLLVGALCLGLFACLCRAAPLEDAERPVLARTRAGCRTRRRGAARGRCARAHR